MRAARRRQGPLRFCRDCYGFAARLNEYEHTGLVRFITAAEHDVTAASLRRGRTSLRGEKQSQLTESGLQR
jgi:hypothetical protein